MNKKIFFSYLLSGLFVLLVYLLVSTYVKRRHQFLTLNDWFDGRGNLDAVAIKFSNEIRNYELTNQTVLNEINKAVKTKQTVYSAIGFQCNGQIKIQNMWCFEILVSIPRDSENRDVILGIPTEWGWVVSDFRYAKISISTNASSNLYFVLSELNAR